MTVNGISGTNGGMQTGRSGMNMQMDPVSKSIQNQIAKAQKKLQELSSDKELSPEDKMKKRQEIQQEITNLNQQLRRHQIEQRKEQQNKKFSGMDDMVVGTRKTSAKKGSGLSQASMQAVISADSSMKQAQVQGSMVTKMEGKAGVLESEIKMDKGRGASTEKKEEELADLQAKAQSATAAQMSTLVDASKITYSTIEQNKRNIRQQAPTDLEKKMTQYTDTLLISKTGQESYKHLSSVSYQDYINRFEKQVSEVYEKDDTADGVKSDCFEHHVNRMAAAYDKMKSGIEEKYAAEDCEPEYYVSESGKIEKLTKEKEMEMLNRAYESHSTFMAASTQIWADLRDFTPSVVYHKGNGQAADEQYINESQEKTITKAEEKGNIRGAAYQAFMSATQPDNQKLSQQYSGNWKDLRLNLNVSSSDRKMLNGIWDYYADKR